MLKKVTLPGGKIIFDYEGNLPPGLTMEDMVVEDVKEIEGNPYLEAFVKLPKRGERFNIDQHMNAWQAREQWTKQYAWAVPSIQVIRIIGQYLNEGIYEIGAGSGYWARMITLKWDDSRYIAYDNNSSHGFTHRYYNVQDTPLDKAQVANLFLCWPSYEGEWAAQALKDYVPQRVIYVGEGHGGCTANDEFHELLDRDFEMKLDHYIPQYEGIHDRLEIWERK